jgi:hypothetical protein
MRRIYIFCILIALISCNNLKHKRKLDIVVHVDLVNKNDKDFKYANIYWDTAKNKTLYLKLSIINTSEKPITFWFWYCSWWENIVTNNDYVILPPGSCDANALTLYKLKPHDSLVRKAPFYIETDYSYMRERSARFGWGNIDTVKYRYGHAHDSIDTNIYYSNIHVKIAKFGLIYLDTVECKNGLAYDSIISDKSNYYNKIIWSNPLYLRK